ncbi:MAG: FG-GAP-like repeat-containing protein [Candidatus Marinimicrobia bacterium]|nr:FG-GAP-like repeat-containing protein [Candidatus Neomarinimicrobiota bacterium]
MRKNIATIFLMVVTLLLLSPMNLLAINGFTRSAEIPVPEADLNNGGIGNMISGVDVDGDGKTEIYFVNNNWNDGATEVIPRIYKLEYDGSDWVVVWQAAVEPFYQNTWPCLSLADLDGDGKMELVWGPVNSTAVSANPDRVLVYEHAGGDVFGVDDGAGGYIPNSSWTIVAEDNVNLRPMDWEIVDIDGDGVDEIIFADRKGSSDGYYFGVFSVDDIPDDGAGTETWTLEISGKDFTLSSGIENKWDVAVVGSNCYIFCESEISKLSWDGSAWSYTALSPMAGGSSVQSAQVVDLDGDGTKEIITAVYDWGDDAKKAVMLLKEDGDTLKHYELVNTSSYFTSGSRGLWGSDVGDIDQDGKLDFVFGSRAGDVNARIFLFSYKGGDITSPDSYEFSVIDEAYVAEGGIWSVVNIVNIDDDPELEVLYTSSASYGGDIFTPAHSAPIIILDPVGTSGIEIENKEVLIAEKYVLHQNYPNPFNPTTTIAFDIPVSKHVRLIIYDMLGCEVISLVDNELQPGRHLAIWNGKDKYGHNVSTGVYIYQLRTENITRSKTMTFIK